jgi:membrane associated rhomboid family serine protease
MTLRRFPILTAAVFVLTATFSVYQLVGHDDLLARFQRDPARIADGEWYRLVTSLVFQDGGVVGTASNLLFLLVLGALVELALGHWRWAALYVAGAAAGQAAGCAFGTVGAGNSIAVCGLAGGILAAYARTGDHALTRRDFESRPLPERAHYAALSAAGFWSVLMVATVGDLGSVPFAAIVVGAFALVWGHDRLPWWTLPLASAAAAVLLAALGDLHGYALLAGAVVGWLLAPRR